MFTARVKADGRFFIAHVDTGARKFAHKLRPGNEYFGLVFDSLVGQTHYVEYDGADLAVFRSDELEGLPGKYRLIRVGGDEVESCEQPTNE